MSALIKAGAGATDVNWLKQAVGRHAFHPMADPRNTVGNPPPIIMRGDGFTLPTPMAGGCSTARVDCGASTLDTVATKSSMRSLTSSRNFRTIPTSLAARTLHLSDLLPSSAELTADEGMARVLYGSGGSDATETAFKMARQYWKLVGEPERVKFISLRGGYHGLHFGGMSACGGDGWRRSYVTTHAGFHQCRIL